MSFNLSNTHFAKWSQILMNALVNLHGMNAEAVLDSNLPRIIVFGDQSAGKSSLVEGVTGVRVPRDSGTCTRCPMDISMFSTGETWSCDIALHFKYDSNGRPVKLADVQRIQFGKTLLNKVDVESALRRAQAAILNPAKPPSDFLDMSEDDLRAFRRIDTSKSGVLKFSKNTISVVIRDPTCANLSFLDLPGLITNEAKEVIDLVQDLAVDEIKKENSLILVTIPMTGDMELQTAVRLAREVDPEGLRTIGVLTKPDAVPKGASSARKAWMEVLSGQDQVLKHGYYCVRLPDDDERMRNLTKDEHFEIACTFFEQETPWNSLLDKRRLGIPGLVDDVSKHLTILIDKALPKISFEVQNNLERCQEELKSLPPAPKLDASVEILKLVNELCHELEATIFGTGENKALTQLNHDTYENFKKSIRSTAPNFKTQEMASFGSASEVEVEEVNDPNAVKRISESLYLRDIRRIIKRSKGWELPHNVPFEAKRHLINQFTDSWNKPIDNCFEEILRRLEDLLHNCIGKHFMYFSQLRLVIISFVEEKLQLAIDSTQRALQDALRLETDILFTMNNHYFNTKRDGYLSRYKNERKGTLKIENNSSEGSQAKEPESITGGTRTSTSLAPSATERALSALAELGFEGLTREDFARLIKPDPFEEELTVMADVMAYFYVAYKRIIDQVPRTIEVFLTRSVCTDLQNWLVQKLDIGANDAPRRLTALISQDPEIAAKRARLEAELLKLKDIQKELRNMGILKDATNNKTVKTDSKVKASEKVEVVRAEDNSTKNVGASTSPNLKESSTPSTRISKNPFESPQLARTFTFSSQPKDFTFTSNWRK